MINKRGRIIAIVGGAFFLILIIVQNMDKDSIDKDSFYDTFSATGDKISVDKSNKKIASLDTNEDQIKESSESYQQSLKHNKKDKAFSLYREILSEEKKEVVENIIEVAPEELDNQNEETNEITISPKIVYVKVPVLEEAKPSNQVIEEKTQFKRLSSSRSRATNSVTNTKNTHGKKYIKAEIYRAVDLDLSYPQSVDIRILEEKEVTLPNGHKISYGTMLKGRPKDSGNTLDIYVPEYGLAVYEAKSFKGIPLTAAEGLKQETGELRNKEISTNVPLPVIGNVRLGTGKRKESRKVYLNESRTILLKWESN